MMRKKRIIRENHIFVLSVFRDERNCREILRTFKWCSSSISFNFYRVLQAPAVFRSRGNLSVEVIRYTKLLSWTFSPILSRFESTEEQAKFENKMTTKSTFLENMKTNPALTFNRNLDLTCNIILKKVNWLTNWRVC